MCNLYLYLHFLLNCIPLLLSMEKACLCLHPGIAHAKHRFSLMVLLIQITEGLFCFEHKDNGVESCSMHVSLSSVAFLFSLGLKMRKSHARWQEKLVN